MAVNARMRLTDDGILIIRVDTKVKGAPSSTGKSTIIAQTDGRFEDLGHSVDESLSGFLINMVVLGPPPKGDKGKRKRADDELDADAGDDVIRRAPRRRDLEEAPRQKRRK